MPILPARTLEESAGSPSCHLDLTCTLIYYEWVARHGCRFVSFQPPDTPPNKLGPYRFRTLARFIAPNVALSMVGGNRSAGCFFLIHFNSRSAAERENQLAPDQHNPGGQNVDQRHEEAAPGRGDGRGVKSKAAFGAPGAVKPTAPPQTPATPPHPPNQRPTP